MASGGWRDLVVAGARLAGGTTLGTRRFLGLGFGRAGLIGGADSRRQEVERNALIILIELLGAVALGAGRALFLVAITPVAPRAIFAIVAHTPFVAARAIVIVAAALLLLLALLLLGTLEHFLVAFLGVVIV